MVDRGFNIADLLLQCGAKLHIPPFTRKRNYGKSKTLNQSEIPKINEIAKLRIHVERATKWMKNLKILTNQINFHLWPLFHQILVIVAVLCNLQAPLLKYQAGHTELHASSVDQAGKINMLYRHVQVFLLQKLCRFYLYKDEIFQAIYSKVTVQSKKGIEYIDRYLYIINLSLKTLQVQAQTTLP